MFVCMKVRVSIRVKVLARVRNEPLEFHHNPGLGFGSDALGEL